MSRPSRVTTVAPKPARPAPVITPTSEPRRRNRIARAASGVFRRKALLAFGGYAVLAFLFTLNTWLAPTTRYIGGGPDPMQTMWAINWVPFAATHGNNVLFSSFENFPKGLELLWNQSEALPAIVLWPVTAALGSVFTYNLLTLLGIALSACFAFVAVRRYVPHVWPAWLAGLAYGFSPFVTGQVHGHLNLVLGAATLPLALLLFDELVIRQRLPRWRLAALLVLFGVVQFFVSQEFFLTTAIIAVVLLAVLMVASRVDVRRRARYVLTAGGSAAAILVVLLAVPTAIQLAGPSAATGLLHPVGRYVSDALNLVVPTSVQLIRPAPIRVTATHFTGNAAEWDAYLGIPLVLLLLAASTAFRRIRVVAVAGVLAIIATVLSLGPTLHVGGQDTGVPLPWWPLAHLPVLENILPNRLMAFAFLAVAVVVAFTLSWLSRRSRLGAIAGAAVVLVPLIPAFPANSSAVTIPSFFTGAGVEAIPMGTVALAVPWPSSADDQAALWQVASGMRFRLAGGYFIGPASTESSVLRQIVDAIAAGRPAPRLNNAQRTEYMGAIVNSHIGVVMMGLGRIANERALDSFFTSLLHEHPTVTGGIDEWLVPGAVPPAS